MQSKGEMVQEGERMCKGLAEREVVSQARATATQLRNSMPSAFPLLPQCSEAKPRNSLLLA